MTAESIPSEITSDTQRARGRPRVSTPEHIEAVALGLFRDRGFEDTSMDDIVLAAGVSRSTLFRYVESKANILWLRRDEYRERLQEGLAAIGPNDDALVGIADAIIGGFLIQQVENLRSRFLIIDGDDELAANSANVRVQWARAVSGWLTEHRPAVSHTAALGVGSAFVHVGFAVCAEWAPGLGDLEELEGRQRAAYALLIDGFGPLVD